MDGPLSHTSSLKPTTIRLGELAIAGGLAGYPVNLCFRDFESPLLREVFDYFAGWVGSQAVCRVFDHKDLRQLKQARGARLVLVYEPRLYIKASWLLSALPGGGPASVPTDKAANP